MVASVDRGIAALDALASERIESTRQNANPEDDGWPAGLTTERPKHNNGSGKPATGAAAKEPHRYTLRSTEDLAATPPAPYRVKGLLIQESLAVIYGPSGSGKTFLGLDIAFAISDGMDWFGKKIAPCEVVYVALEGVAGQAQRVRAYQKTRGPETGARLNFITSAFDLRSIGDTDALIETLRAAGFRGAVVVIDTFNAATPGMDENASADMSGAIDAIKRIREEFGGLVILIHHTGKDATRGLRGHSSMAAALDTIIEVSRDGDRRKWRLEKAKDGQDGEEHDFRLEVVEVGQDVDGEAVTSCVVVAEDRQPGSRKAPSLSGGGMVALQALQELVTERGEAMPGSSTIPKGVRAVKLEDWRERFKLRYGNDAGTGARDGEASKKAFQRGREGLLKAGLVGLSDPWCWLTSGTW